MAVTGNRSNVSSSVLQRSPSSPCNLKLRLRFSPVPTTTRTGVVSNQKRRCLCSPTTHPGSFRCAYHRRLETEKTKTTKRNDSSSGLNLRKMALVNSLAKIGSVEAERFRRAVVASFVKPSSFCVRRRSEFRPRLSRFYDARNNN